MKKKIAIIGAGIAGLTLANLIKKYTDHEFMVYEREESLSLEEGYGIQLATNSIKILNQIHFNKINDEKIFHPKTIDFYSIQNEKICDLNLSKFNSVEAKYTTLQRSNLIEFLKEDIYTQHLRFGKKIKEVSELKDKVLIKFDDNTNDLVDFVIAADGIFSNTRSFFEKKKNLVGMFWGNQAKKYIESIDIKDHLILTSSHPSPLSVYLGFNGCNHFQLCNEYMLKNHKKTIDWQTYDPNE